MDFQMREHKLRWRRFSRLKKMLTENGFDIVATNSRTKREEFREEEHAEMWFVTVAK